MEGGDGVVMLKSIYDPLHCHVSGEKTNLYLGQCSSHMHDIERLGKSNCCTLIKHIVNKDKTKFIGGVIILQK